MARMVVIVVAMLAVLLAASSSSADARDFHVGGRAGLAPNPTEPFNTWAERNRFQVNDTLVFRYNKDVDAVLVVTQSHYDACNTTEPILRLAGGESRFVFNASGPYFFISADAGRCRAGERLIVVVLAVRNNNNTPSSPTLSPPAQPPKSSSSPPSAPRVVSTPPKSPSSPASPPPVATPAPHALAPPPPAGENASSPAAAPVLAPAPAPAPAATNATSSPPLPSPSSAAALRGSALACLLIIGSAILV